MTRPDTELERPASMMADCRYVGVAEGSAAGPHLVLVYDGAELIGPLPHRIVRHSPTGFSWGYAGSGPAELALNLIVHAHGDAALCPDCRGRRGSRCGTCWGEGTAPEIAHPRIYQAFKVEHVARWPQHGGWEITAAEVRRFVAVANARGGD